MRVYKEREEPEFSEKASSGPSGPLVGPSGALWGLVGPLVGPCGPKRPSLSVNKLFRQSGFFLTIG